MKVVSRIVLVSVTLVVILIFINVLTGGFITYSINSISYYGKSDIEYVSKTFDVSINRHYMNGKSYTYHCTDNHSGVEEYILLDYGTKNFYIIEARRGITESEAINLVEELGYSTNMSELLIFNSDTSLNEDNVISKMRWIVYHDGLKGTIYVGFEDGKIYLDGM